MAQRPAIPKGTRDFLPTEVARRNYIFDTIKKTFRKFGFAPIETPSFELSSTLLGKYGEEGDRLIFRILNSGDKLKKADFESYVEGNLGKFASSLAEKALRYDLTVPFARFVVQHQNELSFPFKRYQIQPVWRADRPQHGRYQEFYQCDADAIGSDSLLYEVDFIWMIDEVFTALQLPGYTIKINNRKILSGIAEVSGEADRIIDITVAIDKLDKIGPEAVLDELREKGISQEAIQKIEPLFHLSGTFEEKITKMSIFLNSSEIGQKGLEELDYVYKMVNQMGSTKGKLMFDITLARGLNYYTGAIFEVSIDDVKMGSVVGGGRYDDLTGLFGLKGMSGIGISFGADRIYDVLNELELFPDSAEQKLTLMFLNFGEKEEKYCMSLIHEIRKQEIDCELYPSSVKIQKQMKYANDRGVKYVAIVGEEEMEKGFILLKNMETGEQEPIEFHALISKLK